MKRDAARLAALLAVLAVGVLLACGSRAKLVTLALGPQRKSVETAREKFAMDATSARKVLAKRGALGVTEATSHPYSEDQFVSSDGAHYSFPSPVDWTELAPGILTFSRFHDAANGTITRYDAGSSTPTWTLEIPTGVPYRGCRFLLRTGIALFACSSDSKTDAMTINLREGSWKLLASIPYQAQVEFAESAERFVAISRADPVCGGCLHANVYSLIDGRLISRAQISSEGAKFFPSAQSFGFDGRLLWSYTPETFDERYPRLRIWQEPRGYGFCYYDVFDLALGGARIRTLDDATGSWNALKRECKVRDLIALPDGGVMALRETMVNREPVTEAVTFSAPP